MFFFWKTLFWNTVAFCSNLDQSFTKPAYLSLFLGVSLDSLLCLTFYFLDLRTPAFRYMPSFCWSIYQRVNKNFQNLVFLKKKKHHYFTCSFYFNDSTRHENSTLKIIFILKLKALFHCFLVSNGLSEKSSTILILNPFVLYGTSFTSPWC